MILEKQDRQSLNEGRTYGMGFSILKKINKNFETYLPFTACKDYLNDLVYIENTGLKIENKIHGYLHNFQNIFKRKKYIYLGICSLDYITFIYQHDDVRHSKTFYDIENIILSNSHNLIININKLEDKYLSSELRTSLYDIQDLTLYKDEKPSTKALILKVPVKWVENPILLSLYCLFIRMVFNVEDTNFTIEELLSNKVVPYIKEDIYLKNDFSLINNIKNVKDKLTKYIYDMKLTSLLSVHNYGIIRFLKEIK